MNKKISLTAALHEASGKKNAVSAVSPKVPVASPPASPTAVPPSRQGKKIISAYFDPAVARQLKRLALEQDSTIQALVAEALNDLFAKYDQAPFA